MEIITIDNINYISGDFILKNAPIYSHRCRSSRELIKTKKFDETKYIYARKINETWIKSDGKSIKFDKVIIKENIIKDIPELNNLNQIINNDDGIEKAPNLLHLTYDEKFKDNEGNVLDIETRGEREPNKIYFRVKDISNVFIIGLLQNIIIKENTLYKNNIDYKYFICEKKKGVIISDNSDNIDNNTNKKTNTVIKKELFLTYEGMLRVLFTSRNGKTSKFIKWCVEKLFYIQMGTPEQKNKLVSHIKGVSYEAIQELFSVNARTIPCVYLTAFNTVSELKNIMNIDNKFCNNDVVYKFGLTKSFESRKNGHKSEYKKLENHIDMKLIYFTYIDPLYIHEAEVEIKNLLSEYKLEWDNHDELVVIPNNLLKIIKTIYENIGMKYSGHTQEFNRKIEELNRTIIEHENKYNLLINEIKNERLIVNKDKELLINEIENERLMINKDKELFEAKLINKDFEIETLKKEIKIKELELFYMYL